MSTFTDLFPAGVPSLTYTRVLGPASWVGQASGYMQAGTGQATTQPITMRCDSALATSNIEASATVTCTTTNNAFGGPVARVPSTTTATYYSLVGTAFGANPNALVRLNRVVSGSVTQLAQFNAGTWATLTFRQLTLNVSGATPVHLEAWLDGVLLGAYNDSDAARIQSGTRAGVTLNAGLSGTALLYVDSFSTIDWVYVPVVKDLAAKVNIASNAKQGVVLQYR